MVALAVGGCDEDPEPPQWSESFDATTAGWLLNVGGSAADDLYAVGGEPMVGTMHHFDGDAWTPVDLPTATPLLNWVHAFDSDDVFVVGNGGTVLHFDGTSWSRQTSGVDRDLWGVWGNSPDDVWAVGGNGREDGQATVIRFDGMTWSAVMQPDLERASVFAWFKVWGTSSTDVWFVGQRGAVMHWDGSVLTEVLVGLGDDLISVWGTGPDNVVIVGGRANGVAAMWNGMDWRSESLSPLPGLNGVWLRDEHVAHVVGVDGTVATLNLSTFEFEEWFVDTRLDVHAVFGADGQLHAVGGSLSSPSAPFEGVALTRSLAAGE